MTSARDELSDKAAYEPSFDPTDRTGFGGDHPRGWWAGQGTTGRGYVRQGRRGYQGYWWYVGLDGWHRGLEWCEHVHKTHELARACGARQAARCNAALRRVRGDRGA